MILDQYGRKIVVNTEQPGSGIYIIGAPSDREETDVSRFLTPQEIDRIMTAANGGDTVKQSRLCRELLEKDWDSFHAVQTRINAVLGIERSFEPGDDSPLAKKIAEEFEQNMDNAGDEELDTFDEMLEDMMTALLPGFAVSENIWDDNTKIAGFKFVPQFHFTFRDSFIPLLIVDDSNEPVELPHAKAIINKYRSAGGDLARGNLIRPLSRLYCLSSVNVVDLARFIERYGMPFTVAKVDENSWKTERSALKALIRNFGPNGGGVFSKSTEVQLLQAANTSGDVYFKLLEYLGAAKTKVVLGQTATAGDGGGWSNDGAQSQVRQDILESDCRRLMGSVYNYIAKPWTTFNYGQGAPVPKMILHFAPPEDTKKLAETVQVLYNGGFQADEKEMSERFGMKLTQRTDINQPAVKTPQKADTAVLSNDTGNDAQNRAKSYHSAVNALSNAFKTSLALSAVGINPVDSIDKLAANAVDQSIKSGAIETWFGKFQNRLDEIANIADPEQMQEAALALSEDSPEFLKLFDSEDFTKILEQTVYAAAVQGKADKAGALNLKEDHE